MMILLSTRNMIGHLVCGNSYNWLWNFNLIPKTRRIRVGSVHAEKTQLVSFDGANSSDAIEVRSGLFMKKNHILR